MSKELTELLQYLTPPERAELDKLLAVQSSWQPLPGPQSQAYYSQADTLFYGGAAGGGKTDLLLGLAHTAHKKSIIFRREYPQLKGIEDRAREMFGEKGSYNSQSKVWRLNDGRQIEFGAVQHLGDETKYQGRPHDFVGFDEAPHFLEQMFRFLGGWLRSADPNQRTRIICAGNPPTDAGGDWIINFFAPWLDDKHINPAKPGELRFFTTLDGKDSELENGEPFLHKGELITPKSRTFIPAKVEDNPYLMKAGYKSILESLPEPLRSKMLKGDFTAGREDNPYQIIPTEWVLKAQAEWQRRSIPKIPMTALGVDVARGGADKTILTPRYANHFGAQIVLPGFATPDGKEVASQVINILRDKSTSVNVDVIGVGSSVYDILKLFKVNAHPMHASEGTDELDRAGQLNFHNKRALWWWRLREALDPDLGESIALPDDRELLADLITPLWKLTPRGILVESKDDIRKRIGRSPDKGDSLVYALADTRSSSIFTMIGN